MSVNHLLFCIFFLRSARNDPCLEFVKKHILGIMGHQVHVEEPVPRRRGCFVDFHQCLLVVDGGIFIQPRIQVLHAAQSERKRVSSLRTNQRM